MKKLQVLLIFFVVFIFARSNVFAKSPYVLPYPSSMPGSSVYKVHTLLEYISKYWYFGNFSQVEYNRKYADKYLVEAKILFEYGQYPFAIKALKKSNYFFKNESYHLSLSVKENKNIDDKKNILKDESEKHIEVLEEIKKTMPEKFTWIPEKLASEELFLHRLIDEAVRIRKKLNE